MQSYVQVVISNHVLLTVIVGFLTNISNYACIHLNEIDYRSFPELSTSSGIHE